MVYVLASMNNMDNGCAHLAHVFIVQVSLYESDKNIEQYFSDDVALGFVTHKRSVNDIITPGFSSTCAVGTIAQDMTRSK